MSIIVYTISSNAYVQQSHTLSTDLPLCTLSFCLFSFSAIFFFFFFLSDILREKIYRINTCVYVYFLRVCSLSVMLCQRKFQQKENKNNFKTRFYAKDQMYIKIVKYTISIYLTNICYGTVISPIIYLLLLYKAVLITYTL